MDTPRPSSDEIDLLQFIAKLYQFLLKNWFIIAGSLAVCLIVSYVSFRKAPKVYESKMVAFSEFVTESYAGQILDNLQGLVDEHNTAALTAKLNMTAEEVGKVGSFKVESSVGERVALREEERTIFNIVVEVSDPSILPNLEKGLVYFFENNEFIKKRVSEKRKGLEKLIARIDSELGVVGDSPDGGSLYPRQDVNKDPKARKTSSTLFDPITMDIYMFRERTEYEGKLAVMKGMDIVDGFVPTTKPSQPNLSVYLASGFSTGVIISLLLLGLRSLNSLSKKYPA